MLYVSRLRTSFIGVLGGSAVSTALRSANEHSKEVVTRKWKKISRNRHFRTLMSSEKDSSATKASNNGERRLQAIVLDGDGLLFGHKKDLSTIAAELFDELHRVKISEHEFLGPEEQLDIKRLKAISESYGIETTEENQWETFLSTVHLRLKARLESFTNLVSASLVAGLEVVLITKTSKRKVETTLDAIGLDPTSFHFLFLETTTNEEDRENLLKERLDSIALSSENCISIETTIAGVQSSRALGMTCLAVNDQIKEDDFVKAESKKVVNSLAAISIDLLRTVHASKNVVEQDFIQDWLQTTVELPGNIKTNRRSILQVLNLGVATSCLYLIITRAQALSAIGPKTLINALSPFGRVAAIVPGTETSRVDGFKRYLQDLESRGGGNAVREFPSGMDWFNSPPLSLKRDLEGKLVILDFWTYCCINCMHTLPDLAYIERKFADKPVTIVGVHSAKFDNERDSEAIRNAVLRYNIEHPVINDQNMAMWKDLGIASWPTLVVLSPKGRQLFSLPGEGHRQDLEDILSAGLEVYGKRGLLNSRPVPMAPEKLKSSKLVDSKLRYPGKLASDLSGNRLFISDSNNHRIVITTLSGDFVDHIGGNGPKLMDGAFESCAFNRPQGLCFDSKTNGIFVADTENHALRYIDLGKRTVVTIAGNGYQGRDYKGGSKGKLQQLNSPWDVQLDPSGESVWVAMAGQHQIWKYNRTSEIAQVFSGNGYERNKNGNDGQSTSWAQPSGLSLLPNDDSRMIVADSESSSIRMLNLRTGGSQLIAGGDPLIADNLFRFGDADGELKNVLLQHPLGVFAANKTQIYVADSYNHKIKVCDLNNAVVRTVCGSGTAGFADGALQKAMLSEPNGFALGPEGNLLVADTNNNLIRVLDVESGKLTTLDLKGIPEPRISPFEIDDEEFASATPDKVVVTDEMNGRDGILNVRVKFPTGYGFTKGATSSFVARTVGKGSDGVTLNPERGVIDPKANPNFKVRYQTESANSQGAKIQADCRIYFCEEGKECLLSNIRVEVPLAQNLDKSSNIDISISPDV